MKKENVAKEIRLHLKDLLKTPTKYTASITVTVIPHAGKLAKKEPPTVTGLEKFDVFLGNREKKLLFHYIPKAVKNMEDLGMTLENHAPNQVQVLLAAQNNSQ